MYQKHSKKQQVSVWHTNRFRIVSVFMAACVVGTLGTYLTIIGPRLSATEEKDVQLADELYITGSEASLAGINGSNDSASDELSPDANGVQSDAEGEDGDAEDSASTEGQQSNEGSNSSEQPPSSSNTAYSASWGANILAGKSFYLGSHNPAATTADAWRSTKPADAAHMDTVAAPAKGIWLVMGLSNISSYVSSNASAAASQGKLPIFVLYGMPTVGCGGPGSAAANSYLSWVDQIDAALTQNAVIIVEPDELPLDQCGGSSETGREQILRTAVSKLAGSGRYMYIDAGHGSWVNAQTMAQRLQRVGVEMTQGFSLNVSNYTSTAVNTSYGNSLSSILGGAHFVIDTSRNGLGPDPSYEWCNAPGRALGELPQTYGSGSKLNAVMWVKYPGESDGSCNGGPSEGQWWPEYALELAQNAD